MNVLDIQPGNPSVDAVYVAYVYVGMLKKVEPMLMRWASGKWKNLFIPENPVLGWIGPLPAFKDFDL